MGVSLGIVIGLLTDVFSTPHVIEVQAATIKEKPVEVQLLVVINWTPERIEQEIRTVFHEEPNTAVAVVKAEGGLNVEIQSHYVDNGVREPSFCAFQIHEPTWMSEAKKLGYSDYKTNPKSCVKMAKYIYDNTGRNFNQWSAYKNGTYKIHL